MANIIEIFIRLDATVSSAKTIFFFTVARNVEAQIVEEQVKLLIDNRMGIFLQ